MVQFDYKLSFLSGYVEDALECGAAPYVRQEEEIVDNVSSVLHYDQYPAPEPEYSLDRFSSSALEESSDKRFELPSAPKVWSRDGLSPSSKAISGPRGYGGVKKGWGGVSKYSNRHKYEDSISANAKDGGSKSEHVKEATRKQRKKKKAEVLFGGALEEDDSSSSFVPTVMSADSAVDLDNIAEKKDPKSRAIEGRWKRHAGTAQKGDDLPVTSQVSPPARKVQPTEASSEVKIHHPAESVGQPSLLVDLGGAQTMQAPSMKVSDTLIAKPIELVSQDLPGLTVRTCRSRALCFVV